MFINFEDFLNELSKAAYQQDLGFTFNRDMNREREIENAFRNLFPEGEWKFDRSEKSFKVFLEDSYALPSSLKERIDKLAFNLNCNNFRKGESSNYATCKVKNLKYAYHITNWLNKENILKKGLLVSKSDKDRWRGSSISYKNALFLGYPLQTIIDTMGFDYKHSKNVIFKIDTSKLNLYFDPSFAFSHYNDNLDDDDISCFLTYEDIPPNLIEVVEKERGDFGDSDERWSW